MKEEMDHVKKIREQNSRHYWSDQRYGAKLFVDEGAYVFVTGHAAKIAVITGATSGMALNYSSMKARTSLSPATRQEMLDKAVKEIGKNNVTGVQGDAGRDVP